MSWLDIIIVVGLALSTLSGLKTGLIKAVLTLAGLIIGVILAGQFYEPLSQQLAFISNSAIANIAAFAIIVVAVLVLAAIVAGVLKWTAEAVMLGWLNRLGGAAFGLVLGAIFFSAALVAWVKFIGPVDVIMDSGIATFLLAIFPVILNLLPQEFDDVRSLFA
ncbi:MAG: CvpA family protein [Dehalococcoidales bacterium]|jgi:membrane protein required for colicin V production